MMLGMLCRVVDDPSLKVRSIIQKPVLSSKSNDIDFFVFSVFSLYAIVEVLLPKKTRQIQFINAMSTQVSMKQADVEEACAMIQNSCHIERLTLFSFFFFPSFQELKILLVIKTRRERVYWVLPGKIVSSQSLEKNVN